MINENKQLILIDKRVLDSIGKTILNLKLQIRQLNKPRDK